MELGLKGKTGIIAGGPRSNALGRVVEAKEVAWLIVYLASERAEAVTGELIEPNGGYGNAAYY